MTMLDQDCVNGHSCERCHPEEFPEYAPLDSAPPFRARLYPSPALTLDGRAFVGYYRGYTLGVAGWVDVCGMTPGVSGAAGLHLCPCVGFNQCHHRVHADVGLVSFAQQVFPLAPAGSVVRSVYTADDWFLGSGAPHG